jgi:hypothetical protein
MRLSILAALVTLSAAAHADSSTCAAQSERAQQDRSDGHLKSARSEFKACAATECPAVVRADCERSYVDVDRALPSIVVIARSGSRDVTDVRLVVDDEVAATGLDGNAISIDPGAHRVRLETRDGRVLVTHDLVAHAAEKNRVLELAIPTSESAPVEAQEDVRHHGAGPWIVFGVGVAAAVGGVVLVGVGQTDISQSKTGCAEGPNGTLSCTPTLVTPSGQDRLSLNSTGTTLSNAGLVSSIAGGVVAVVGLVWHFLEPTGPRHVSFAPVIAPSFGGATFSARF